jgi:hypothetical protein
MSTVPVILEREKDGWIIMANRPDFAMDGAMETIY